MPKRHSAPSIDEIQTAIERAKAGKGRQLALIVKSFSVEDLAKGFEASGRHDIGMASFHAIIVALNYCSGIREERARTTGLMRKIRKQYRADLDAKSDEVQP